MKDMVSVLFKVGEFTQTKHSVSFSMSIKEARAHHEHHESKVSLFCGVIFSSTVKINKKNKH